MELVKKIIFIIIILFYGCKDNLGIKQSKNNLIKTDSIRKSTAAKDVIKPISKSPKNIIEDNLICFIKEKELSHDNNIFIYNNFSLGLSFDVESQTNYLIYKKGTDTDKYILEKDNYDQPEFDIKVYTLDDIYVYILETIDYYSSIAYIYIYIDGILTRLGDISIDQPNVEEEGIKTESFKICKENDTISIECFLDNELVSTHKFEIDKSKIIKKN